MLLSLSLWWKNQSNVGHFELGQRCQNSSRMVTFSDRNILFFCNKCFQHSKNHLIYCSNVCHSNQMVAWFLGFLSGEDWRKFRGATTRNKSRVNFRALWHIIGTRRVNWYHTSQQLNCGQADQLSLAPICMPCNSASLESLSPTGTSCSSEGHLRTCIPETLVSHFNQSSDRA